MAAALRPPACGDPDGQAFPQPSPVPLGCDHPVSQPELDLSLTLTPERPVREEGLPRWVGRGWGQMGHGQRRNSRSKVHFHIRPKSGASGGKSSGALSEEPHVVAVAPEKCSLSGRTQTLCRSTAADLVGKKNMKKPEDMVPTALHEQPDAPSEGVALNTTLALKAELMDLAKKQFDPRKAVQQQLKLSTHTRNHISSRATEGVNIPRSQQLYQELISISVSEDQLISQALHDRLVLVPPSCSHGNKEPPAEGPNLLAFYSPGELLRETPFLPGDELKLPRPHPVPHPSQATFDLYHRQRQWEA
ncbi:protein phosphatase 1 regulatory subunit 35 [Scleropages formosus]|uniref:Protein phosphatase 1, regulatory subunit 35 n=1 Tax=Scleropages formosus TaxID=113540 RepID=A0A8C9V9I7_SCLFO|nr:protein phosphatase 1 regulatory subunit 35 [Scleropages formosus]XP_018588738.1 protein phosphatase 1 regulatory subunit 35 [Scleropages formosus]